MTGAQAPSAAELADRFGTPLYAYDVGMLRRAHALLAEALPDPHGLLYSLKANPLTPLVGCLRRLGCGGEVSSTGEVRAALAAGFDASGLFYTGPGKAAEALREAMLLGVRRFSVESAQDAARIAEAADRTGVEIQTLLRLSLPADKTRLSLRMGGQAQFGMPVEEAARVARRMPELRAVGLHIYQGSNVPDGDAFVALAAAGLAVACAWREDGLPLEVLNLGGGFPARHATEGALSDLRGMRPSLEAELDRTVDGWRGGQVQLLFESGRYLTAASGRLICRVLDVKVNEGRRYVVTDSGIHHLGGLSGLGRLLPVNPRTERPPGQAAERYTVVGNLCTPADSWGVVPLEDPQVGSLLTIPNAGAYGLTASLIAFLSHPSPLEVVTDGQDVVSVHRTTVTSQAMAVD